MVDGQTNVMFDSPVPGLWQFWFEEHGNQIKPSVARLNAVPWQMEFRGASVKVRETSGIRRGWRAPGFLESGSESDRGTDSRHGSGGALMRRFCISTHRQRRAKLLEIDVPDGADRLEIESDAQEGTARTGLYVYRKPEDPAALIGDKTSFVYYDASHEPQKRYVPAAPAERHVRHCGRSDFGAGRRT